MTGQDAKDWAAGHWGRLVAFAAGGTAVLGFFAVVSGAWSQAGLPELAFKSYVNEKISEHVVEHARQMKPVTEKIDALTGAVRQLSLNAREARESSLRIEQLGLKSRLREIDQGQPASASERFLVEKRLGEIDSDLDMLRAEKRSPPPF